jgi:hypothetical protein
MSSVDSPRDEGASKTGVRAQPARVRLDLEARLDAGERVRKEESTDLAE